MQIQRRQKDRVYQIIAGIMFCLVVFVCIYPFYYMLVYSLSDPAKAAQGNVSFWPVGFTLKNYKEVFALQGLYSAFLVSVLRTGIGTIITLFFTSILAYTLTKEKLVLRKAFYRVTVTAMYLNAGLIPWYLTMRNYGLNDTFLLYILPGAVSVFSMIIIKTYIESTPTAIEESAHIDGANYLQIYFRIILPLCIPVLAAAAVFSAVYQWNSWYDNMLLVSSRRRDLNTLQYTLLQYLLQSKQIAASVRNSGGVGVSGYALTPASVRVTVTMVVTLPILVVYPFMQRYFISGMMLGAVKG